VIRNEPAREEEVDEEDVTGGLPEIIHPTISSPGISDHLGI
jgi:hypothetical protein